MAFYTILLTNNGFDIVALKATTTPTTGTNWSEQDGSVRVETGGGKIVSMWAVEDSSDLHVATQQVDGRVKYHVFDPGTDAWTKKNETVAIIGDHANFDEEPEFPSVSIALRSDGDVMILLAGQDNTTNDDLSFIIVNTGGSWGTLTEFGAGAEHKGMVLTGPDSSDRITAFMNRGGQVTTRSISSSDVFGTLKFLDATPDTATMVIGPALMEGNQVFAPYIDASDKISVVDFTAAANPSFSISVDISDNTVKGHGASAPPFIVACMAVKGSNVHLLYADDATQDIFHDADVDGGGITDVERNDGVTANRLSCHYLSGSDNLAWLYLDGTTTRYDELSLAVAGLLPGGLALMGVGR